MIWPVQVAGRETYNWQAAERHMNALRPAYHRWRADFEQSRNGRIALEELNELRTYNPRKFRSFREEVLFACWCAESYGAFGIVPDDARKKAWEHLQSSIPKQLESIRTLIEFFESNKLLSVSIMYRMYYEAKNKQNAVYIDEDSFVKLLKNLEFTLPHAQEGGLFTGLPDHQWVACLDFGRSVRGRHGPENEARVGLEFELALLIRLWTSGVSQLDRRAIGNRRMPSAGNPCYPLIAMLLLATFEPRSWLTPDRLQKERTRVRNRLNRFKNQYPNATYIGWPVLKNQN